MGGGIENSAVAFHAADVPTTIELPEVAPDTFREDKTESKENLDPGFLVICWNDPVNLMDFVTHVFQQVFAWKKEKAEFHMMQVHNAGKSVLVRETMERAEFYVHELQKYQLHATMEPAE